MFLPRLLNQSTVQIIANTSNLLHPLSIIAARNRYPPLFLYFGNFYRKSLTLYNLLRPYTRYCFAEKMLLLETIRVSQRRLLTNHPFQISIIRDLILDL